MRLFKGTSMPVTVSTLKEAEVLADAGLRDIFYAVFSPAKAAVDADFTENLFSGIEPWPSTPGNDVVVLSTAAMKASRTAP